MAENWKVKQIARMAAFDEMREEPKPKKAVPLDELDARMPYDLLRERAAMLDGETPEECDMRVFQAQTDVLARENEENEEAARCAQEEEDKRYRRRFKIETEVKEEVKDERERRRAAMRSETAKPQATKAGKKLSDHEQKVWKVIQQRAKGLQYCRELDKADAKPPRTGVWKECAGTYTAAYRLGDPWRHRIQNEKSKTKRKAALAGLAELASE